MQVGSPGLAPGGTWQCIAVALYVEALAAVIGLQRHQEKQIETGVVTATENDPGVGHFFPWGTFLLPLNGFEELVAFDGGENPNAYEACTRISWKSMAGPVAQYFMGATGGLWCDDATSVLKNSFISFAWFNWNTRTVTKCLAYYGGLPDGELFQWSKGCPHYMSVVKPCHG